MNPLCLRKSLILAGKEPHPFVVLPYFILEKDNNKKFYFSFLIRTKPLPYLQENLKKTFVSGLKWNPDREKSVF